MNKNHERIFICLLSNCQRCNLCSDDPNIEVEINQISNLRSIRWLMKWQIRHFWYPLKCIAFQHVLNRSWSICEGTLQLVGWVDRTLGRKLSTTRNKYLLSRKSFQNKYLLANDSTMKEIRDLVGKSLIQISIHIPNLYIPRFQSSQTYPLNILILT